MPADYVGYCLSCQQTRMAALAAGYAADSGIVTTHADCKRFDPATVGAELASWAQSHVADGCARNGFVIEYRPAGTGD